MAVSNGILDGATASSSTDDPSFSIDGTTVTSWYAASVPNWIKYDLGSPVAGGLYTFITTAASGLPWKPTSWTFEGSNDDSSWDVLDTQSGVVWGGDTTRTFSCNNATFYRYYKFNFTAAIDSKIWIEEINVALSLLVAYEITASAGSLGIISPSGVVEVFVTQDQSFTITPASGCQIDEIIVDDVVVSPQSPPEEYVFADVDANHTIHVTFVDVTPPSAPTDLEATQAGTRITLNWTDSTDNVGVVGYRIYDGNQFLIGTSATNAYSIANLTPGFEYFYQVSAVDAADNESELSNLASVFLLGIYDVSSYLNRYTHEYQNSARLLEFTDNILQYWAQIKSVLNSLVSEMSIDSAIGSQLDVIGTIVGQSRTLPFQPSDGIDPVLTDSVYRQALKAKIAMNHWDGQLFSIEEKWADIFPGTAIAIQDNQDMSVDVSVSGALSTLIQEMIENRMIVPRPQAVYFNLLWAPQVVKLFSYDIENVDYDGYDVAHWGFVE